MVKAEIITIGDEILYGQIQDTNSQWMSARLDEIGVRTVRITTVGDNADDILTAFTEAEQRADIILITGGLGPTKDDLTKSCLAQYFNCEVSIHKQALEEVTALFKKFGRELSETNREQAALPEACEMISNEMGSAPGMWFDKEQKVFASMPGVPVEMKRMMKTKILPRIREQFDTPVIFHKMIKTLGIGESYLSDILSGWEDNLPDNIKLAYLPGIGQVRLRLTATGDSLQTLQEQAEDEVSKLSPLIEKYIFGYDGDTIEQVIGQLLKKNNLTLATAESCTGGFLAHSITSIPGSSAYFQGGIIPYHNNLKQEVLGVEESSFVQEGAVSEPVVRQMAERVREMFNADIGVSTSGIAGPSGGSDLKPVGTIWIGYADGNKTLAKKLNFGNERVINIKRFTLAVLYSLHQRLIEID